METLVKTKWAIDPTHSEIGFKVKHMMLTTVKGHFNRFEAYVEADDESFKQAEIEVSVDIYSIDTRNSDRDAHLKSDEFFHAAAFPKLTFRSVSFDGSKLVGDLTIRGITRRTTLDVDFTGVATDPYGQTKAGFEIIGEINRKEFGLKWNAVTEAGNIVVSDTVQLIIDAQFVKQD
jgi:polyisoprenoid-binding protein YceI